MTEHLGRVDCIVIGAGVVGLACARAIALSGREVMVLEAEPRIGEHTSGRNSEVIHAGIYYPTGSLKAQFCVEGKHLLYPYLQQHGIEHRQTGKLIVASCEADFETLERYQASAAANGVEDLQLLDRSATLKLEPDLKVVGGLLSPSTGILDSHAYMLALQGDLEAANGVLAFHAPVTKVRQYKEGYELEVGQGDSYRLACGWLVNAAGLCAWDVAQGIEGLAANKIPPRYYAKGHYMTYSGHTPFKRLVYPVAQVGGLGVHLTLDMAGQARFGPDVHWIEQANYAFEPDLAPSFAEAIQRYWPAMDSQRLQAGYVGVRPKLSGPGEAAADFLLQDASRHGMAGLVQLFGIESPGLTSSLAIGDAVLDLLEN